MQPPPLRQRMKVVAVVLSRRLRFRVPGATARGAIQSLHGRGRDCEQQFGWQMLRVVASACKFPARSLITVSQSRPVCAPRSRAPATPHSVPQGSRGAHYRRRLALLLLMSLLPKFSCHSSEVAP